MKQYTHAWLALKAMELLKSKFDKFDDKRNKSIRELHEFLSSHPSTFLRGAWFPDNIIRDNIIGGGHTWKYSLDPVSGKEVTYRPPSHNTCLPLVQSELDKKVKLNTSISDLPDRCEALSQVIRDTSLITNRLKSGDVISFNDSQIATLYLMLSHYVCDAHVPLHCDERDLYDPSKVHDDLEAFWERQVKKHFGISRKRKNFDLDENQSLELKSKPEKYSESVLYNCEQTLKGSIWEKTNGNKQDWQQFLGKTNKNLWDYIVSVCIVSFHMSLKMFPENPPGGVDYQDKTFRIMKTSPYKEDVIKYSPNILADAINSVAVVWLATWERWELLKKVAVSR